MKVLLCAFNQEKALSRGLLRAYEPSDGTFSSTNVDPHKTVVIDAAEAGSGYVCVWMLWSPFPFQISVLLYKLHIIWFVGFIGFTNKYPAAGRRGGWRQRLGRNPNIWIRDSVIS